MNKCGNCDCFRPTPEISAGVGACFLDPPTVHFVMVPVPSNNRIPMMIPSAEVKPKMPEFRPQAAMQRPMVQATDGCSKFIPLFTFKGEEKSGGLQSADATYSNPSITKSSA